MAYKQYIPCAIPFILPIAAKATGYISTPALDLLKIAGAMGAYIHSEQIKKQPFAPKKAAGFYARAWHNALIMSLKCITFKPVIKAFSVYINVPEDYRGLFTDVFQALINTTNGVIINKLTKKHPYYTKDITLSMTKTLLGWGIKYGVKTYVYESDYLAEFLSGFTMDILMNSIGCGKKMTYEEQAIHDTLKEANIHNGIIYKGYLCGLKRCSSKLVSTYLPQEGPFIVKVLEKTAGTGISAYILEIAAEASKSMKIQARHLMLRAAS